MGTRRWFGELEAWLRKSGMTRDELAKRSSLCAPDVIALFQQDEPNPTLEVYLNLVQQAGARFNGVETNEPLALIRRIKEIMARENISNVSALSRVAGVHRSTLSTLLNAAAPNPTLDVFDKLVHALGGEQDFVLVSYSDKAEAKVIAAGAEEVKTIRQDAAGRHLHAVPGPVRGASPADPWQQFREAQAERTAAEEREKKAQAKLAEVNKRVAELHAKNVALEKESADQQAEIVRQTQINRTLERLRAEDLAERAKQDEELLKLRAGAARMTDLNQKLRDDQSKLVAEIRELQAEAASRREEIRKLRAEGPPPKPYWSAGKIAAAVSFVAAAGAAGYALGNRK
ncbi:MAG: helix-turn-helix domain-containing protein [Myxococcales bacterium]|nr:helix-turn-helix domain-containing protein [Myxococcales bacterium]